MNPTLPLGKLDFPILDRLIHKYKTISDPRVVLAGSLGEDAAVIEYPGHYLIVKTDPVTFATDEIGWYAVHINANDVASMGAVPKFFLSTILLPYQKADETDAERIFAQISEAAKSLNVSVIGGHTEVTHDIDRPIIAGTMLGEAEKSKLVMTSGAREGDVLILTKGIVIEGTAIIAREKHDELISKGYEERFLKTCKDFLLTPGLSVLSDALLANQIGVHAMHDPTEGGLAAGLYEIACASHVGMLINRGKIPILKESAVLCREYGLDPLKTITSGALLIAAPRQNSGKIISALNGHHINATEIGEIKKKSYGLKISGEGKVTDLDYSAKDEITKIFQ